MSDRFYCFYFEFRCEFLLGCNVWSMTGSETEQSLTPLLYLFLCISHCHSLRHHPFFICCGSACLKRRWSLWSESSTVTYIYQVRKSSTSWRSFEFVEIFLLRMRYGVRTSPPQGRCEVLKVGADDPIMQLLWHCTANLQVVGSNPVRVCVCVVYVSRVSCPSLICSRHDWSWDLADQTEGGCPGLPYPKHRSALDRFQFVVFRLFSSIQLDFVHFR